MRIFDRTKTKELALADLNLDLGQLVSSKLGEEHILIYNPLIGKVKQHIKALKARLSATDYKAIKYAEGELSAEEYESVKLQRRAWREKINELEAFIEEVSV
jgi:hypothetical protein